MNRIYCVGFEYVYMEGGLTKLNSAKIIQTIEKIKSEFVYFLVKLCQNIRSGYWIRGGFTLLSTYM